MPARKTNQDPNDQNGRDQIVNVYAELSYVIVACVTKDQEEKTYQPQEPSPSPGTEPLGDTPEQVLLKDSCGRELKIYVNIVVSGIRG